MNVFGRFIWDARGRKEWDVVDLARVMGAKTPSEMRRMKSGLASLEHDDQTDLDFFRRVAAALEVPPAEVEALIAKVAALEAVELEAWLSVPQPMMMRFPAIPDFYCGAVLNDMTQDEAEAFVSGRARSWFGHCALEVSRRLTIWYEAGTGRELRRNVRGGAGAEAPYTVIAGTRDGFTFVSGEE